MDWYTAVKINTYIISGAVEGGAPVNLVAVRDVFRWVFHAALRIKETGVTPESRLGFVSRS